MQICGILAPCRRHTRSVQQVIWRKEFRKTTVSLGERTVRTYMKRFPAVVAVLVTLGYMSNAVMITLLSNEYSEEYEVEKNKTIAASNKWDQKQEVNKHVESGYWVGPYISVKFNALVPFVVIRKYYILNPFDVYQLGGSGYTKFTTGFFYPMYTVKGSYYVH